MIYAFVFIFGAIIGSFLNVVIKRYNTGESIIYSDSRCLACGKKLSWSELIPICSFLLQKGKCRGCHSKISRQYPLVEFLTGLLFLSIFLKFFPDIILVIFYWIAASLLIIISVYDFYHQIIPDKIVYLLIFLALGYWFFIGNAALSGFLAGLSFFLFFFLLWISSRGRSMGLGDSKIALAAGWILGFENGIIAILFSFWIGAILGVFLLLFSRKTFTLKSRIPFGPFLSLGIIIAFLFGESIIKAYFNIFL
ncbi:MAG: prepilin peptidase [Candidatus Tagabacteria bacterium CG_4_8_14_3_um_filter_41_8]|uniref:Prepilin peptidase n=2 Tax=Patescibacteria group TaxID=1783273 RepID=A0A2M8G9H7_9BACT|nr:MAG: prepilin peptidase [Candidatus Shapirobacteria bacterium CG11_big_fil_rev_8_21_14_0_20_40_12]PJC70132.1 MAG: prepilin peptidase [Candidatus Tagabacteria bacterium CG_4_8_14_3_um_filter_41_8]